MFKPTFFKDNFFNIIILVLVISLFIMTCGKTHIDPEKPTITRDTVWVHSDSTVYSKPQIIKTIPVPYDQWTKEYLPDTNYVLLLKQYIDLAGRFQASNIHSDSFKIDSVGNVYIEDTVNHNKIMGRKFTYNLKYPIITNTITLPAKKHNQLYIGGSIMGNQLTPVNQINAGFLWRNKKENMLGLTAGLDFTGHIQYGIQSYYKISFRKP